MIQPTHDGNFVVTADLGMDQLLIYGFDSKKGKFIDLPEKTVKVSPGQGPRHFIFHPNHPRLYLINELGNTLMTFSINLSSCLIEGPDQTIETLPSDLTKPATPLIFIFIPMENSSMVQIEVITVLSVFQLIQRINH